jgi:hypothetical protein
MQTMQPDCSISAASNAPLDNNACYYGCRTAEVVVRSIHNSPSSRAALKGAYIVHETRRKIGAAAVTPRLQHSVET